MSIRVTVLMLFVAALFVYAWRDWFVALCGLILMMGVLEHPDMPKSILGIQGVNPWNILMFAVLGGWATTRRAEGLVWDMPGYISAMLLLYLFVVVAGWIRMVAGPGEMEETSFSSIVAEYLVNTIKWVIPGLLLFDGCRSSQRLMMAVTVLLGLYFLLGIQVIKWMPPSSALSGDDLSGRSLKIIANEIGYSRVNMSRILAGASWAVMSMMALASTRRRRLLVALGFLVMVYAQALTAGRMGYVTWGCVGLIMCTIGWRKKLLLLPIFPVVIAIILPGTAARMMEGFAQTDVSGQVVTDDYLVTAGRTQIWPHVIDKIGEGPVFGHGREAMVRTGVTSFLSREYGSAEAFPHPHNAYLELLLDNGMLGAVIILPFFGVVLFQAARLFLDRSEPWFSAIGGMTLAIVLAFLIASAGSQTFYPREGDFGMWCAIGLMFRMMLERRRIMAARQMMA